jgi:hypothetical protein
MLSACFLRKREEPMSDWTRGERLQIMLTGEELEALDNWRFARRMPSRAAAIRELLKRGLNAEGFEQAQGRSKSGDFGVTTTEPRRHNGRNNGKNAQD